MMSEVEEELFGPTKPFWVGVDKRNGDLWLYDDTNFKARADSADVYLFHIVARNNREELEVLSKDSIRPYLKKASESEHEIASQAYRRWRNQMYDLDDADPYWPRNYSVWGFDNGGSDRIYIEPNFF